MQFTSHTYNMLTLNPGRFATKLDIPVNITVIISMTVPKNKIMSKEVTLNDEHLFKTYQLIYEEPPESSLQCLRLSTALALCAFGGRESAVQQWTWKFKASPLALTGCSASAPRKGARRSPGKREPRDLRVNDPAQLNATRYKTEGLFPGSGCVPLTCASTERWRAPIVERKTHQMTVQNMCARTVFFILYHEWKALDS